jgi:hypothetical protein
MDGEAHKSLHIDIHIHIHIHKLTSYCTRPSPVIGAADKIRPCLWPWGVQCRPHKPRSTFAHRRSRRLSTLHEMRPTCRTQSAERSSLFSAETDVIMIQAAITYGPHGLGIASHGIKAAAWRRRFILNARDRPLLTRCKLQVGFCGPRSFRDL